MVAPGSIAQVLAGYERDASALLERYDKVPTEDKLAAVADLLPQSAACVADIGAGTGADAAWFAAKGHRVLAIEPVASFRTAGQRLHPCDRIEWLADALPLLAKARARAGQFDLVLASAVWQHLPEGLQEQALRNVARLSKPGGRVLLSIRNGPGAPGRPTFPVPCERIVATASSLGLQAIRRVRVASMQQRNRDAGVTWDWLAFDFAPAAAAQGAGEATAQAGGVARPTGV